MELREKSYFFCGTHYFLSLWCFSVNIDSIEDSFAPQIKENEKNLNHRKYLLHGMETKREGPL